MIAGTKLTSSCHCVPGLALVVEEFHAGMVTQTPRGHDRTRSDVVGRWFRALDQRPIRIGQSEWLLQVTSIFQDGDEHVWIQIADAYAYGGSVLLRVSSCTSVDHAVHALATERLAVPAHPVVVVATGIK